MCGYGGGAADVPEPLRQAIRLLVGHWYENRGVVAIGHEDRGAAGDGGGAARALPGAVAVSEHRRNSTAGWSRASDGSLAADVKAMKLDEAKAIYRAKYWDAQRCDELPAGID